MGVSTTGSPRAYADPGVAGCTYNTRGPALQAQEAVNMAHNLAKIEGQDAMFCVGDRDAAWHHLGQRTGSVVTWVEAMKLAKLDWQVTKQPSYSRNPVTAAVTKDEGSMAVWRFNDRG